MKVGFLGTGLMGPVAQRLLDANIEWLRITALLRVEPRAAGAAIVEHPMRLLCLQVCDSDAH